MADLPPATLVEAGWPELSRPSGMLHLPAYCCDTGEGARPWGVVRLPGGTVTLQEAVVAFLDYQDLARSSRRSMGPCSPTSSPSSARGPQLRSDRLPSLLTRVLGFVLTRGWSDRSWSACPWAYSVDVSAERSGPVGGDVGMAVDDLPLAVLAAVDVGDAQGNRLGSGRRPWRRRSVRSRGCRPGSPLRTAATSSKR